MITLRKQTINNLGAENTRILEEAVEKFIQKDEADAEKLIWKLCYQPDTEMIWLGFPLGIPIEKATIIREELESQYKAVHPEWNYGRRFQNSQYGTSKEAQLLMDYLKRNRFAFDTIMQKILDKSAKGAEEIDGVLNCLFSQSERSRFGGLKKLGFNQYECEYLLPVSKAIAYVLKSMAWNKIQEYRSEKRAEKKQQTPIFDESQALPIVQNEEQQGSDKVSAENDGREVQERGNDNSFSPIELIKNRKEIEAFYKALETISKTPNAEWLSEHEVQVKQFFVQCDRF